MQEKADQVSAWFSLEQSSLFIFYKKHQDEWNVWIPHSCRISWTRTSTCLHQFQQRRKRHRLQRSPKYLDFWCNLVFPGDGVFLREADTRSLLPQKSSQPCQVALPSVPKYKKMPFVAGKVEGSSRSNSFSGSVALDVTVICCCSRPAPAIRSTPTFKASSTWWSTTSPGCVNKWALCTDPCVPSGETSRENSSPSLPGGWERQIGQRARSTTCT